MAKKMIGKRFRAPYADLMPLWEVKRSVRRGVYLCEAVNEPIEFEGRMLDSDAAGTRKLFLREEIESALANAEYARASKARHDDYYASLPLGAIVHYGHGFGTFIRCEVVIASEVRPELDHYCVKPGMKCLRWLAFVGEWKPWDLKPEGHMVRWLAANQLFCPNHTTIYESPSATTYHREPDPAMREPCLTAAEFGGVS